MSRRTYIGVDGIARKVKKIYVGVNGIAQKVKKAYIGVSNLARQFFGGYDSIQKVSDPIKFVQCPINESVNNYTFRGIAAGNLKNKYALFAGSFSSVYTSSANSYYISKFVYAVDEDLVVTSAANLARYSAWLQPASLTDYVVFAGGTSATSMTSKWSVLGGQDSSYAYGYGIDLIRHDLNDLYTTGSAADTADNCAVGAGNGKYAIYPRWDLPCSASDSAILTTYDNDLIQTDITTDTTLEARIGYIDACRFDKYAVFFGTADSRSSAAKPTTSVYAYDQDLIKHTMSELSDAGTLTYPRQCVASTNYVVLAGGRTSDSSASELNQYPKSLEVYDKNLIKISTDAKLSYTTEWFGTLAIDNWIIFCGGHYGYTNTGTSTNASATTVNIFDENLIRTIDSLDGSLTYAEGASVGDYGILIGNGTSASATTIFQGV